MAGKIRTIIESTEFTEQIAKLGGAKKLDSALDALLWGISCKPDDFPFVPGLNRIQSAKTDAVVWLNLPPLIVFFKLYDNDSVTLLWIELSKSE